MSNEALATVQALVDALEIAGREIGEYAPQAPPRLNDIDAITRGRALISQMKQEPAAAQGEPASDTVRLDYLQRTGSTVDLLPASGDARFRFRIGGLHAAVNADLRAALDAAIQAEVSATPSEQQKGGE